MSEITISIGDTKAELVRLMDAERRQIEGQERAGTLREKRYHQGRLSAFQDALETVDLAERSQAEGGAVRLRNSAEIEQELARA